MVLLLNATCFPQFEDKGEDETAGEHRSSPRQRDAFGTSMLRKPWLDDVEVLGTQLDHVRRNDKTNHESTEFLWRAADPAFPSKVRQSLRSMPR